MFTIFKDPGSMSAGELELFAQNQLMVAIAIVLFLLFFRSADQYAKYQRKQRSRG